MLAHWMTNPRHKVTPLVHQLRREGIAVVSLSDLQARSGLDRQATRLLAARIVSQGHGMRIARGLYQLRGTTIPDALGFMIRAHGEDDYRLSHTSAMAAHGFGPPLPHAEIYMTAIRPRPDRKLPQGATLRFLKKRRELPHRALMMNVPNVGEVKVSDLETTVLDLVHRPQLIGGILGAARFIAFARQRLKLDVLVADAMELPVEFRARIGLLLDVAGLLSDTHREMLRRELPLTYPRLDVNKPDEGPPVRYWKLRLNVPFEKLQKVLDPR